MGSSRWLVVSRPSAPSRVGWWSCVVSAVAVVAAQPALWLMGSLGFCLRGGILLLLASIIVLPTPIELRMLLGANLGSSGLEPEFVGLLIAAGALVGMLVLVGLALVAYLELAAFERLVRDPEVSVQLDGREALPPAGTERRWLLLSLFGIQLLALGGVLVAAIPLIDGIVSLAYQEIVRPSLGGTIYVRVLNGVREPLFVLLTGLVLVELVSSLATRRLMLRGHGLTGRSAPASLRGSFTAGLRAVGGALLRPLRRPVRTLATLLLVWAASVTVLLPISWALAEAWAGVRVAYLGPPPTDVQALASVVVVTLGMAALWLAAVLLGGFVSALRGAFWSVDALR